MEFIGFSGSALSFLNNEKLCHEKQCRFLDHASFKIILHAPYKSLDVFFTRVFGKCGDYLIRELIESPNLNEDEMECDKYFNFKIF